MLFLHKLPPMFPFFISSFTNFLSASSPVYLKYPRGQTQKHCWLVQFWAQKRSFFPVEPAMPFPNSLLLGIISPTVCTQNRRWKQLQQKGREMQMSWRRSRTLKRADKPSFNLMMQKRQLDDEVSIKPHQTAILCKIKMCSSGIGKGGK